MNPFKKAALGLLMVTTALSLGWAESFEGIRAAAEKIHTLETGFIQEKQMRILAAPLIAKGRLLYQGPKSLRWEYVEPIRSVLLMHDGESRRFTHSDQGWREDSGAELKSMQFVFQEISNWLTGRFDENPLFSAALMPGGRIVLTPKGNGMDRFIERIEMVLADEPGLMKEVLIFEGADSLTRFHFIEPKLNRPIPEAEFQSVQ